MTIDNELIDNLLKDYKQPEDLMGENGLLKQLTKQLLERAMAAELTEHVGYEKHEVAGHHSGNSRNGKSAKTLKGSFGTLPIAVPRDRNGTFEPQIIGKHQTRFTGFDEHIISLYARGLSTREIQQHLEEIYQVEVSPALISRRSVRRSADVAESATRRGLRHHVSGRYPVQSAGRRPRQKQSRLPGDWHRHEWPERSVGLVDRPDGRSQ